MAGLFKDSKHVQRENRLSSYGISGLSLTDFCRWSVVFGLKEIAQNNSERKFLD